MDIYKLTRTRFSVVACYQAWLLVFSSLAVTVSVYLLFCSVITPSSYVNENPVFEAVVITACSALIFTFAYHLGMWSNLLEFCVRVRPFSKSLLLSLW